MGPTKERNAQNIIGHLTGHFQPASVKPVFVEVEQGKLFREKRIYMLTAPALERLREYGQINKDDLLDTLIRCRGVLNDIVDQHGNYIPAIRTFSEDGALSSVSYYTNNRECSPALGLPSVMTIENGLIVFARSCDENDQRHVMTDEDLNVLNGQLDLHPFNPLKAMNVPMLKGCVPA